MMNNLFYWNGHKNTSFDKEGEKFWLYKHLVYNCNNVFYNYNALSNCFCMLSLMYTSCNSRQIFMSNITQAPSVFSDSTECVRSFWFD